RIERRSAWLFHPTEWIFFAFGVGRGEVRSVGAHRRHAGKVTVHGMDVNVDYGWRFGLGVLCEREDRAGGKEEGVTQESAEVVRGHLESPFCTHAGWFEIRVSHLSRRCGRWASLWTGLDTRRRGAGNYAGLRGRPGTI